MNFLFLRGQIPQDRNPKEIVFDKIEECDDVWTQLFFNVARGNPAELWYWGGNRDHYFSPTFRERWVPSFKTTEPRFQPDVIICRGGFPEYHSVLSRFPNSIKIYYGAGRRYLPQKGFSDYDIILQDSPEQLAVSKRKFPNALSTLFIKPAADNLFSPVDGIDKEFDICFPANGKQKFKGHDFIYSTAPADLRILNLGNGSNVKAPGNVFSKRVLRIDMSKEIQRCKVGIVACDHEPDSCPRVIPEMLASGIPVVSLDRVRFWQEKYITNETGRIVSKEDFWLTVRKVIEERESFSPSSYYEKELSINAAGSFILEILKGSGET